MAYIVTLGLNSPEAKAIRAVFRELMKPRVHPWLDVISQATGSDDVQSTILDVLALFGPNQEEPIDSAPDSEAAPGA